MKTKNIATMVMGIIVFFILIVSCGSGGGSSSGDITGNTGETDGNPNGADDTAVASVARGEVEGFGSIIVNGTEFETDGASVEIENEDASTCSPSATEDCGIHIGMLVTLENAFDDNGNPATVTRIRYEDAVEGPISAVAETTPGMVKTLTVMGQTVILQDGVTRFDDSDAGFDEFSDVGAGNVDDWIEVSGHSDFDGAIRATYVQRKALAQAIVDRFEVQGTVSNLNPSANSFQINDLTIDFTGVVPRNGTLVEGGLVEVKGDILVGETLQATDVEIKTAGLGVDDVAKAHLEGFVARLDAAAQTFEVNGQRIDFRGAVFIGASRADLADGLKVEADGPVSGGVLQAMKIVSKENVRIEANVEEVDAAAGTLTLGGLAGITVQTDGLTAVDGFSDVADLAPGDNLKIRGRRWTPAGATVIAVEIERVDTNPADRIIVQGPVDSFTAFGSVEILGISVDTTTIEDDDFKDGDTIIGEAAFFDRLAQGALVKARFDLSAGAWDQIEFED